MIVIHKIHVKTTKESKIVVNLLVIVQFTIKVEVEVNVMSKMKNNCTQMVLSFLMNGSIKSTK